MSEIGNFICTVPSYFFLHCTVLLQIFPGSIYTSARKLHSLVIWENYYANFKHLARLFGPQLKT